MRLYLNSRFFYSKHCICDTQFRNNDISYVYNNFLIMLRKIYCTCTILKLMKHNMLLIPPPTYQPCTFINMGIKIHLGKLQIISAMQTLLHN